MLIISSHAVLSSTDISHFLIEYITLRETFSVQLTVCDLETRSNFHIPECTID